MRILILVLTVFSLSCSASLDYKKWKSLPLKKNLSGEKALQAVRQNPYNLRFVIDQTEEICLEAVKKEGEALRYVIDQTKEIVKAAVRQDGHALKYVIDKTEEICLEAVRQNGYALKFVKDQTEEIVKAAVEQNSDALQYVEERFFKKDSVEVIINGKSVKLSDESVEAIRRAIN